jgi:hypothetical protein
MKGMKRTYYKSLASLTKTHRTALHLLLEGHIQGCVAQTVGMHRVTIARLVKSRAGHKFMSRVRNERLCDAIGELVLREVYDLPPSPMHRDYRERGVGVFGERSRVQIGAPESDCRCKGYHGMRAAVQAEVRKGRR